MIKKGLRFFQLIFLIFTTLPLFAEFSLIHRDDTPFGCLESGQQATHSETHVVYANPGDTLRMYRPERMAFTGYIRWYCYDTDSAAQRIIHSGYKVSAWDDEYTISNGRGLFKRRWNEVSCGTGRQTTKRKSYFEADYIMSSDSIYRVAVDQSIYKDYVPYNDWRQERITELTEPTLSKRIIYEMHQASEIASRIDSCVGEKYLEVHKIIAPTGRQLYIGPDYSFITTPKDTLEGTQAYEWRSRSNYYYNASSPIQMGIKSNWVWNGKSVNPITCQFIGIKSDVECTNTYTLRYKVDDVYYNIAKFIVTFMDVNHVGPVNNIPHPHGISLIYEQNFNDDAPNTTELAYWGGHFHIDESSYGYYFPNMDSYRDHHCGEPNWCEYGVVNKQDIYGTTPTKFIYNHNDTVSGEEASKYGYMLFVDGSERTGRVFNLKLNAELCPGSKMYFSAWVIDASPNKKSAPNLDFIVTGVDESGVEYSLATFTTGEFGINAKMKQGEWYQIMFPIKIDASEIYHTYKLKITNKGKSADGNDFAIDDIRIYVEKPAVMPIQASTSDCIDKAVDTIRTYLRIDYQEIDHENQPLYYQWRENDKIVHTNYYNIDGYSDTFGKITLLPDSNITASDTCSNLLTFDKRFRTTDSTVIKYIMEEVEQDSSRYVMYIAMPMEVRINHEYTGFVSLNPNDLGKREGCGTFADILIAGGTRIAINDEITFGDSVVTVCGHRSYTLNIVLTKIVQDETHGELRIDTTHCRADWLIGDYVYVDAHKEIYKYSFEQIETYLKFYRQEYVHPEALRMVNFLKNQGLLILDTASIVMNPGVSLSYTAFPLDGTASDGRSVCTTPRFLHIKPAEPASNMMEIGDSIEILPEYVLNQPRIIRISNAQKNKGIFRVPMYLRGDTTERYIIDSVYIISSTNPDWKSITLMPNHSSVNLIDTIELSGDSDFKALEAGYDYTFHIAFKGESDEDRCDRGYTYFTLRIIPDVVTWYGDPWNEDGDTWNEDASWDTFIPMRETNVILLKDSDYNVLFNDESLARFDINYTEDQCNHIYFPVGSSMAGQERITINGQAYVDIQEYAWKWNLTSIPLKGVVTGDLFIKHEESTFPFLVDSINQSVGTYAIDRVEFELYHSEFNKFNGKWESAKNTLDRLIVPGEADMIGIDCETDNINPIIRLPKVDNFYRYYERSSHVWLENAEYITRLADEYGKPAFVGDTVFQLKEMYDNIYLFGNPSFGYVDITKLVYDNSEKLTGRYYLEPEGVIKRPNVVEFSDSSNIYLLKDHVLLPPTKGILLEGSSASNTLLINVTTNIINELGKIPQKRKIDSNITTKIADPTESNEDVLIYDIYGRYLGNRLSNLPEGFYILKYERNVKKIYKVK